MSAPLENKGSTPIPAPLAFASWLATNQDKLQPPVNNYCLYSGADFVLMVVGGPNERNDFHGESLFIHKLCLLSNCPKIA